MSVRANTSRPGVSHTNKIDSHRVAAGVDDCPVQHPDTDSAGVFRHDVSPAPIVSTFLTRIPERRHFPAYLPSLGETVTLRPSADG